MSGIVGIVHLDGAPVDETLLRRMTAALARRGPDATAIRCRGGVGFGHALLSVSTTPARDPTLAALDDRLWITADARLDGRDALVTTLESRTGRDLRTANDADLLLRAYDSWGETLVEHLLGDFSFAIWDHERQRLFCARDHFGVRPFYHARIPGGVAFSNTLECLLCHPAVGDRLDERAIGDFLLFGSNYDDRTTTFAGIQRLPPAHTLVASPQSVRCRRYWTLSPTTAIRYRRAADYVDRFDELLREAVGDRLDAANIGIWMSGGLDSTAVAATALRLVDSSSSRVGGHTVVYDDLIPDRERDYAAAAAGALGLEIRYFVADGYRPFEGWDHVDLAPPEPSDDPFLFMRIRQNEEAASQARVLLSGDGGDEILLASCVVDLLGRMPPLELVAAVFRTIAVHRRRPGGGIRSTLRRWLGRSEPLPPLPAWLNPSFAARLDLESRWREVNHTPCDRLHALRSEACVRLSTPLWTWLFESCDAGATRMPTESRYPLLDIRLVGFLLAIPPLPWCIDKEILRLAMRGWLPDRVRLRRKAPLAGDPLIAWLRRSPTASLDAFDAVPELDEYVDRSAVPRLADAPDGDEAWINVRPRCLNHWLARPREQVAVPVRARTYPYSRESSPT